jgi:hypothetical protein
LGFLGSKNFKRKHKSMSHWAIDEALGGVVDESLHGSLGGYSSENQAP